jgi:3-hydroxybutyrate dehydrogenase
MSFDLKNRTALVTGAGRGICLLFASRLLQSGCNVVIADLALTDEAKELLDKYTTSPRVIFHETDATDWVQLQAAFNVTVETFKCLDIVCPGAGIFDPVSSYCSPWRGRRITTHY